MKIPMIGHLKVKEENPSRVRYAEEGTTSFILKLIKPDPPLWLISSGGNYCVLFVK